MASIRPEKNRARVIPKHSAPVLPKRRAPKIPRRCASLLLMAFVPAFASIASAAEEPVTFTRDVLPILQGNCQDCHRPSGTNYGGMIAPMSLMTFDDARPWAKSIAQEVSSREMPPWDAAPIHNGEFSNERTLTDAQIETIQSWVRQGSRRGRTEDAPPPREFKTTGGWMIGEPDLIITMPEPYWVGDDVYDLYTGFPVDLTEEMLPDDVYIQAFQCKPGSKVIHHFNGHLLAPDEDGKLPPPPTKFESDALSPRGAGVYIGGVSSGTDANIYPDGYGLPLKKGTRVTFDIHYHKEPGEGTGVWDQSQIGFKFCKKPPRSALTGMGLFYFNINIAPGESDYKIGPVPRKTSRDLQIISLMPHMHTRGKAAKFEAFYPDGTSEVLLDVPNYDFSWQTVYYFEELKFVPKGTRIEYTSWYDNSPEYAAERGFDPAQRVKYGQKSSDEMMMGFVMAGPPIDGAEPPPETTGGFYE